MNPYESPRVGSDARKKYSSADLTLRLVAIGICSLTAGGSAGYAVAVWRYPTPPVVDEIDIELAWELFQGRISYGLVTMAVAAELFMAALGLYFLFSRRSRL
jgi:hypothetical protein